MDNIERIRIPRERFIFESGEVIISHNGKADGNYAFLGEKVKITVRLPSVICAKSVKAVFLDDSEENKLFEMFLEKKDCDFTTDSFEINMSEKTFDIGLYFFYFEISGIYYFYSKNINGRLFFSTKKKNHAFQLTVTKDSLSKNTTSGIIYHIFVDRFNRGGSVFRSEKSIYIEDWYSDIPEYPAYPGAFMKNNTFFGGTLFGIKEKLSYLFSLGVSLIYLSPIFCSPSNHKYDTADYMSVDGAFGGDEALKELIKEAKKYGIGVILDGVFNHTGSDSRYFNKFGSYEDIGAYQSKKSKYYGWYTFEDFPEKYVSWWGIDILPKLSYDSGEVENFFLGENGVIEKYMSYGIKGFRLDVVDELSDSFVEKMRALMDKYDKDSLLFGEVWEDASNKIAYGKRKKYYLGSELNGVMNYPLRRGLIAYIASKDYFELEYALNSVTFNMPKNIRDTAMNILGTHDTARILTELSGKSANGKENSLLKSERLSKSEYKFAKRRLKAAYTLLASLPGIPTVYYGDEAGMEGYSDPFNRRTYPWGREDAETVTFFQKIGNIRKENRVFSKGDFRILRLDRDLFVFERRLAQRITVTVYNNSESNIFIEFTHAAVDLIEKKKRNAFILSKECAKIFSVSENTEVIISDV